MDKEGIVEDRENNVHRSGGHKVYCRKEWSPRRCTVGRSEGLGVYCREEWRTGSIL